MIRLLNAIYKLGKLYLEKEGLNEFEVLLDNKNIGAVLSIDLIEDDFGNFSYDKVSQEDYDTHKKMLYLYKKGSSRGANISPSSLITGIEKTFNSKFLKWFENNQKNNEYFKKCYDFFEDNKDNIISDLNEVYESIDVGKSNVLLTLKIFKNNQYSYLGDIDLFKESFIETSFEKFYKKGSKEIKGESCCFLCDEHKTVYGLVASALGFAFSTPEKLGNVPGNHILNQWKLLPICADCALYLAAGKNFIEKYLSFKEFGLSYYVIPTFLFDSKEGFNKLYSILKSFEKDETQNSKDEIAIENKLFRLVKKIDDIVEFKFLFYESSNSAFNILAYVESVIPSWLNKLYDAQYEISDFDFFNESNLKNIFGNKHTGNVIDLINNNEKFYKCSENDWFKKILRDFTFSFSKKIYIDLVVDVISNKKLDYKFLMNRVMDKIRSNWRNNEGYALKISVLKSLMLLVLMFKLNLIKGVESMDIDGEFSLESLLNSPDKKASFLLGALTKRLLNVQYRELGSNPFYNKLWGLSLDQKKIKKLYPMVINKLREYNITYLELEENISKNLINSESNWKLNRDETSYFFVLGFTMPYFEKNNKKEDDLNE